MTRSPATDDERLAFWRGGMERCARCETAVTKDHVVDGCRHNGDAWGEDVFTCPACAWETAFKFDEYDGPYYFETTTWKR